MGRRRGNQAFPAWPCRIPQAVLVCNKKKELEPNPFLSRIFFLAHGVPLTMLAQSKKLVVWGDDATEVIFSSSIPMQS